MAGITLIKESPLLQRSFDGLVKSRVHPSIPQGERMR